MSAAIQACVCTYGYPFSLVRRRLLRSIFWSGVGDRVVSKDSCRAAKGETQQVMSDVLSALLQRLRRCEGCDPVRRDLPRFLAGADHRHSKME